MKNKSEDQLEQKLFEALKQFNMEYRYKFPMPLSVNYILGKDLGLDSLGILELSMRIETVFNINIHDDDIDSFKTVADIKNYLIRIGK